MKRKVIQLAGKTLVVSLPSKWARQYGVKKGDEIDVIEDGGELRIGGGDGKKKSKLTLNLDGLGRGSKRVLASLYKGGVDEVEFKFSDPQIFKYLSEESVNMIGFEVMSGGNNSCLIKEISTNVSFELDNIQRLVFQTIVQIGADLVEALSKSDLEEMDNIISRDKMINRYTDFCRRNLNKYSYSSNTNAQYSIIESLEKIGDCYNDICRIVLHYNIKAKKKLINLVMDVNQNFEIIYNLHYKFDNQKYENFIDRSYALRDKLIEYIAKVSDDEKRIVVVLYSLVTQIFDINGAILQSSFGSK